MKNIRKKIIKNLLFPVIGLTGFFVAWSIAAAVYNKPLLLTGPWVTALTAVKLLGTGNFWLRIGFTLLISVASFAISFVFALGLALLSVLVGIKNVFSPVLTIIRAVPTVAVITLIMVWTNASVTPIVVGVLIALPVLYTSFLVTLASADKDLIGTALVFGCGKAGLVRFVYLPLLRRSLIENSASGLSLTLKVVISAEIIVSAKNSIGQFIESARISFEAAEPLAAALLVAFLCILLEFLIRLPLKAISD